MERVEYEREIFANLFKTANVLQVYLDHLLSPDEMTAKQMFLMIVVGTFGEDYPTLKEVAEKSSSSYQNVKQLAIKLEKAGFIEILEDKKDRRKKRLVLTKQASEYWQQRDQQDQESMNKMFVGCSLDELKSCLDVINRLQTNIQSMEMNSEKE